MPVETQIVHYPEREKYVASQGKYIKATAGSQAYNSSYATGPVATSTYVSGSRVTPGSQTYYTTGAPTSSVYNTGIVGSGAGYTTGGYTTGGYTTGGYTTGGYTTGGYTTGPTGGYTTETYTTGVPVTYTTT